MIVVYEVSQSGKTLTDLFDTKEEAWAYVWKTAHELGTPYIMSNRVCVNMDDGYGTRLVIFIVTKRRTGANAKRKEYEVPKKKSFKLIWKISNNKWKWKSEFRIHITSYCTEPMSFLL